MKLHPLPSRHDKDAMDAAHRMRAALAGDVDDDQKAATIKKLNTELSASQLILDAWQYLPSDERRAWKLYCKQG
jgi:hypothetical protein